MLGRHRTFTFQSRKFKPQLFMLANIWLWTLGFWGYAIIFLLSLNPRRQPFQRHYQQRQRHSTAHSHATHHNSNIRQKVTQPLQWTHTSKGCAVTAKVVVDVCVEWPPFTCACISVFCVCDRIMLKQCVVQMNMCTPPQLVSCCSPNQTWKHSRKDVSPDVLWHSYICGLKLLW